METSNFNESMTNKIKGHWERISSELTEMNKELLTKISKIKYYDDKKIEVLFKDNATMQEVISNKFNVGYYIITVAQIVGVEINKVEYKIEE